MVDLEVMKGKLVMIKMIVNKIKVFVKLNEMGVLLDI